MLGIFDTRGIGECCYGRFCKNVLYGGRYFPVGLYIFVDDDMQYNLRFFFLNKSTSNKLFFFCLFFLL